jgi:excisionase family DNA binding protein
MGAGTVMPIHDRLFDRLDLLTVSEFCAILRCHEKTLYQWVKKGSLTAIVGCKLKFDPADLATSLTPAVPRTLPFGDAYEHRQSNLGACR